MNEKEIAALAEAQHEDYRKANKGKKYDLPFDQLPPNVKDSAIDQARFFANYLKGQTRVEQEEEEPRAATRRPLPPIAPSQLETPIAPATPAQPAPAPRQVTPVEALANYALQVTGSEGAAAIGVLELAKLAVARRLG